MTRAPKRSTRAPEMGATRKSDKLSRALFPKTRCAVLGLLWMQPERAFYLRELARAAQTGQGAVQRELGRLAEAGIISRVARGGRVFYQANRGCPIFEELRGLMLKTAGLADVLRGALQGLGGAIECAFIYGSQASGDATARSDVDLLVVGDVDEMALHGCISKAEEALGREVNYTLLSRKEFERRRREEEGFLSRVLRGPKIAILGNPDEI